MFRKRVPMPPVVKAGRFPINLALASFGAAVEAVALGMTHEDALVNAIMTGHPERLPRQFRSGPMPEAASPEEETLQTVTQVKLQAAEQINRIAPQPVSMEEFCSRPENVNIEELCGQ